MSAIATGAKIRLFGLQNNAFNGLDGVCHGISESGRYIIEVQSSKKRMLIKRENIDVIPRSTQGLSNTYLHDTETVKQALAAPSSNASWAKGLSSLAAAEWFVDCYRMRLDDECEWKGYLRPGTLYDYECHTPETMAVDFLVYCHLARFAGAITDQWDWVGCLDKFGHLLKYQFTKRDAGDKYGRENIFSGMMGGRSLRLTGENIYGSSAVGGSYDNPTDDIVAIAVELGRMKSLVTGGIEWDKNNILFESVGGFDAWIGLLNKLK